MTVVYTTEMGRKPLETPSIQTAIRLDQKLIDAIDAEVEHIKRSTGVEVTRSQVMRSWLQEMAEKRGKKK
jgi:hypothetical protein